MIVRCLQGLELTQSESVGLEMVQVEVEPEPATAGKAGTLVLMKDWQATQLQPEQHHL